MFYFNTNIPGRIFLQNTSCIGKRQVISRGGGNPLHLPPRFAPACSATYRTGLHGYYDYGVRNSRYNVSTEHAHSIFEKKKNETVFENLSIFDHKCDTDWQLNEIMCQSPVEVSILPHFFSCCDRPLLRLITVFWSQKLNLPRDSQTQTHFYLHTVNLKLIYWKPVHYLHTEYQIISFLYTSFNKRLRDSWVNSWPGILESFLH